MSDNDKCAADKCSEHSGFDARVKNLENSDSRQWSMIEKIQSRPPVWATAVISLLTFLLGCSLTYAGLITKFAEVSK